MRPIERIHCAGAMQSYQGIVKNYCGKATINPDGTVIIQAADSILKSANTGTVMWIVAA